MTQTLALGGEHQTLLREVGRFCDDHVAPRVARPERLWPDESLLVALAEADALGMGGADDAPSGLGLWETITGPGGTPRASLDLLWRIARADAAFGYALHQRALGRALARWLRLASDPARALGVVCSGRVGLGRQSFARWLDHRPLAPDEGAILADVWGYDAPRLLVHDPALEALVWPSLDDAGQLTLSLFERDALALDASPAHGLDGLTLAEATPRGAPVAQATDDVREAFVATFTAHQLALLAISAGATEAAVEAATSFAAIRRQGGALLHHHPAVLAHLGRARAALESTSLVLAAFASRPLDLRAAKHAVAARAQLHPALADAVNAALQVFGGVGYMRDTGIERRLRDVNHLRAMAGTPPELTLLMGEWERIDA